MKKKIKNIFLLLLNICIINGLEECDFEEDECGWFSGGDVGVGSFIRTSSEEQQNEGSDLYPTPNIEEKGHYMFAHSNSDTKKFSLSSPAALNSSCLMFIFNLNRVGGGSFTRLQILQDSSLVWELRDLASVPRDEWLVGSVATLPGQSLSFQLVAGGDNSQPDYVAIDDLSLSDVEDCRTEPPEALLPDTPSTSSTAGQCAHQCQDGSGCFDDSQRCDFVANCPSDKSDEQGCPPVFLFDDCLELTGTADCGWKEDPRDSLDWKMVNESMIGLELNHAGVFLWIEKDTDDFQHSEARIKSPIYQNSASDCTLEFRYFIGGSFANDTLQPAIYPDGAETEIILDYLTLTDEWKHHSIGLGRRRGQFEIVFVKKPNAVYSAQIAVDDVMLTGCGLPQPESECLGERPVRCGNGACIEKQQQCDLSYDCGDDSDELGLYCDEHSFLHSTFEDDDKPWGEFEPAPPSLLQWRRGTGRTDTQGVGPTFDHSSLDNNGHFLFVDSQQEVAEGERAELLSKVFQPGYGTDNECEIIFYYHMSGGEVGRLQLVVQPQSGEPRTLFDLSGEQGNKWHRQYSVVENSTEHGPYFLKFTASPGPSGHIALDDVVFTYNCRLQDSEPTSPPPSTTPAPGGLLDCTFEAEDLCGWNIDFELNNTNRFHFERRNGDQNILALLLPDKDHDGSRTKHFLWADAISGNPQELTAVSSPLVKNEQDVCFNFWFDVREDAGIKFLKIETEIADDDNTKKLLWYLTPKNGVSEWTLGRVNIPKSVLDYKVVVTAKRSNKVLGYVAIDDFEFIVDEEGCSTLPDIAAPTSPAPPTTTTVQQGGLGDCDFETEDLCGWNVDKELNDTQWFYFKRTFGAELTAGGLWPGEDHNQDTEAHFMWSDATLGKPDSFTSISSPVISTSSHVCFTFWFDLKKEAGIRYLQIQTEVEGSNSRDLWWELRPDQGFDLWELGRINIELMQNYKIVVTALRGDSGSGYVAVDDFQFQFDSEDCGMIPEVASPSPASSTTSAPPLPFPDCQFEEDECGWLKDPVAAMKWERKTKEELDNESLDGPEEAGEGYFMYVGAKEGAAKGTTTLATPMAGAPAAGCLRFQFSLAKPEQSGISNLKIYSESDKGQIEYIWDVSNQAVESDGKWWIGQLSFNAYRLVFEVFHADNNKKTGYAALDTIKFDVSPGCPTIPPTADPSQSTTTPPSLTFPDCQFEEDECGWVKEEEAVMKWRRTNKLELDGEGLESPNYDYKERFIYVGAAGPANGTTSLATPMGSSPVEGCLTFQFSMTKLEGISNLKIYTESNEGYIDYIWDLPNSWFEDDKEWWTGQIHFTAYRLVFQVFHSNNENQKGFAALDAVSFNYDLTEECPPQPTEAGITTPRPDSTTTPPPAGDKFPDCKFEGNTCGWVEDEFSNMKWMITNVADLTDEGIYDSPKEDYDGHFLYVSAKDGHDTDSTTLATRMLNTTVTGCLQFYFNIYPLGGIKAIKIFTEDPDGYIQYIWDLTDYAPESDQEWWKGQVNFNTHRLMFEVNHGSNESQNGFAALDSIKFDYSQPSCDVEPPGAAVSPTEPPETSTYVPPEIQCDFEQSDFCDFQMSGSKNFNFTIKQGEEFGSPDDGPQSDDEGNAKGHFAFLQSGADTGEGSSAMLETEMITAEDHMIQCLQFKIAIKADGGVRSVSVIHQSQEQEDQEPEIDLLWVFTSEMATSNDWFLGRVEVRAHYYQDVPQNYTVRLVAEHGKTERTGWVALDKIQLSRAECELEPKEAAPPTFPPPTETTSPSAPPDEDIFCSFQQNKCNFTIQGSGDFKFARTKASTVGLIGEDHSGSPDGMILFAEAKSDTPDNVWTSVSTYSLKGDEHIIECFTFWFFIDGFLDGNRNETLFVSLDFQTDKLNNSVVWEFTRPTPEWTKGQVELRSEMVEDKYVDWQITVMGIKPGDMKAFIAVDDFGFRRTDICELLPPEEPSTTTASPCPSEEFSCGDGTCIPQVKKCNFQYDCPNDSADEDSCPQIFQFESCSSLEGCLWTTMDSQGMDWTLSTGAEVSQANQTNGPFTGSNNNASNHFMYLKPLPDSITGFAQVASPEYQNSYSECYFNFFVYLADGEPRNHPRLIPKMVQHFNDHEYLSSLDAIGLESVTPGAWEKVEIGIGRHRDRFKIFFFLTNDENPLHAGVAVDDVTFFECAPPPPEEDCLLEDQFHCLESKACVLNTELCDNQDDCGDNSDEVQNCESYQKDDFEDPERPFGHFSQSEIGGAPPDDFVWENGNGTTGYRNTGPPFDHTTFSPTGHYLFIRSILGLPGDAAWLWSGVLGPANRTCQMRFFSHMHGRGVGNLTVYIRNKADGNMKDVLNIYGIDVMDVNKWKRSVVELPSEMDFYVIIEATVGVAGHSDIAVDDITFTPECTFKSGPPTTTPTPTQTPTSTKSTSTKSTSTSTKTTSKTTSRTTRSTSSSTSTLPETTQTDDAATAAPGDSTGQTALIVGVVVGVVILLALLVVSVVTVRKRNIKLPTIASVRGLINPGYSRMNDGGMVSLKELSSRENNDA